MPLPQTQPIYYPTSDGRPLGETDVHREQIIDLIHGLKVFYADRPDVYVSGNILMFYEEGDGNRHRSPDVLVAPGRPRGDRDFYKIWEEGKAPDLIIEVTSKSTRIEDMGEKKGLYAVLGVSEYLIFDPLREYLRPSLRAWRLAGGEYVPVAGEAYESALGLTFRVVNDRLRIFDSATGEMLPTSAESEARARQEAAAREEAERTRAEAERTRAQAEAALAAERERNRQLQEEVDRLRRRLEADAQA